VEYCQTAGDRLIGVALISVYDIGHAVEELERCAKAGLRGAMVWQVPPKEFPFMSDHYEPFWAAAQDLEIPVSLHILTGHDYTKTPTAQKGIEVYRTRVNEKIWGAMNSLFEIIFAGVLERHPRLKVVMVENDIGWIPFLVEQWDKYYSRHSPRHPIGLSRSPGDYFHDQVFATFLDDEVGAHLASRWGMDNFMWSNDYPHPNGTWPRSREIIARDLGHLPAEIRAKIVRGNVARLYNLKVPQAV
jgi:predicted TIM-barrel fold metal-dependent hydrolase